MATYRDAPAKPRPIRVVKKRSPFVAGMLLVFLLVAGAFTVVLSVGRRFTCDRASDVCTSATWYVSEAWGSTQRITLSHIERAEVAVEKDDDGDSTSVRLVVTGSAVEFGQGPWRDADSWVAEINAFLKDGARARFEAEELPWRWPIVAWVVVFGATAAAWLSFRSTVTVDRERGLVCIQRPLRRREVPLEDVRRAELRPLDDGCMEGLLVIAGGELISFTTNGNTDNREKKRFVDAVSAALTDR
jgi:hypothetical protein